jgi:pimeloyl-ACP methyl ester carboxylesterase
MTTYVLVHGGWDGGWAWRAVAKEIQAAGHEVFTPTLTGSGERVHLASPAIDLETQILDVANVLQYENLHHFILVGLSYGGMIVTGVAERMPERIDQLVYLDGLVPQNGQSIGDLLGPEIMAVMEQQAQDYGDGWRIPHNPPEADRRTPIMLKAAKQPLAVSNPQAARIRHTFIQFTNKPPDDWLKPIIARIAARAREAEWNYREMSLEHFPLLNKPHEVASLLLGLA